ncbi:MAG: SSU ribosomal protein S6p, partial [uncultured Frankineae bacterium]
ASLRAHGHPRPRPGGAHHRSLPRHVPQRRAQRRRDRGEGRRLGPSPALVRDRQEGRGHLRRRRPERRAGRHEGAGPPAQPQRVDPAHQGHATGPAREQAGTGQGPQARRRSGDSCPGHSCPGGPRRGRSRGEL